MINLPGMLAFPILYEGLIWFVIGHLMIIFNDIFAYLFGITFGKTPLIKLSPNKTVEGFVVGIVGTMGIGYLATLFLV